MADNGSGQGRGGGGEGLQLRDCRGDAMLGRGKKEKIYNVSWLVDLSIHHHIFTTRLTGCFKHLVQQIVPKPSPCE